MTSRAWRIQHWDSHISIIGVPDFIQIESYFIAGEGWFAPVRPSCHDSDWCRRVSVHKTCWVKQNLSRRFVKFAEEKAARRWRFSGRSRHMWTLNMEQGSENVDGFFTSNFTSYFKKSLFIVQYSFGLPGNSMLFYFRAFAPSWQIPPRAKKKTEPRPAGFRSENNFYFRQH